MTLSSSLNISTVFLLLFAWLHTSPVLADGQTEEAFPYELHPVTDSILGGSAILSLAGYFAAEAYVDGVPRSEIEKLRATQVNRFDRLATRQWSHSSVVVSTVAAAAAAASPAALSIALLSHRKPKPALVLLVMALEAATINYALTGIAKVASQRPRPYLYNPNVSLETKLDQRDDAARSFYSLHTSSAFCGAIFFAKVFSDLVPSASWRALMWSLSLSLAATAGALRVTAGKHFPTDVLTGAVAGTLVGYIVPTLHRKRTTTSSLALGPWLQNGAGLSLSGTF
jgi:membrane-associated phospholipid phosphatase